MRRLVLWVVLTFGRYTSLLIFLASCAMGYWWLSILDTNPMLFVVSTFVVIPALLVGCAVLIGLLFSGLGARHGAFVSRDEAPDLWQVWDEFAENKRGRRQLIVDEHMNASMGERHRFLGLFGRETTMTVGYPLMMCLDVPALRSVIAHEIAHSELRHTSGGAAIAEFEQSLDSLFAIVDPDVTLSGAILHPLLGRFGTWLEKEDMRLSRQHEFEADSLSATKTGAANEARSSVLAEAASEFYGHEILEPLQKDILGAMKTPLSPIRRLEERLDEFRREETIIKFARKKWDEEADPLSTHPPLRERLLNVGFEDVPSIDALGAPAIDGLIPTALNETLKARFEREWSDYFETSILRT